MPERPRVLTVHQETIELTEELGHLYEKVRAKTITQPEQERLFDVMYALDPYAQAIARRLSGG